MSSPSHRFLATGENFIFASSFPIPPQFLKSKKPLGGDPAATAVEIAPMVFLHIEPWPTRLLLRHDGEQDARMGQAEKMGLRQTDESKPKVSSKNPNEAIEERETEEQGRAPNYYGLTLCVGKYIYTSVVGVHELLMIDFILDNWLKWVPLRGSIKRSMSTTLAADHPSYPAFITV